MARKFLYIVAGLTMLVLAGAIALSLWFRELSEIALVPSIPFEEPAPLATDHYSDPAHWLSHPTLGARDPARWMPEGGPKDDAPVAAAVFFVHPTSYLSRSHWNAPEDDRPARELAAAFQRGTASAFNSARGLWSPHYRQATYGAFMDKGKDGQRALDAAYADVDAAFTRFLAEIGADEPIVLAGHSQGAYHLRRLVQRRVAGTPLARRIAAVYAIGWPVSIENDLPLMKLPACASVDQAGCVVSWLSFAEPADSAEMLREGPRNLGLDGKRLNDSTILCSNPLTGGTGGSAPASAGLGSLKPSATFMDGRIVPQITGAQCAKDGSLRIGPPPELGPYVADGNNYHVYDIPLFWMNLRADFARRVEAWYKAR